jgi:hypothetical protein
MRWGWGLGLLVGVGLGAALGMDGGNRKINNQCFFFKTWTKYRFLTRLVIFFLSQFSLSFIGLVVHGGLNRKLRNANISANDSNFFDERPNL